MVVGLTGGIGAGKSTVAGLLAARGAVIIDTDAIAREVVRPPSATLDEIVASFGPGVLLPDGTLDRAALARLIFDNAEKRRRLNSIVHPAIRERAEALVASVPRHEVVALVVPLLFESDYDWRCDVTVAVVASKERRLARVAARDGLTPAEIEARMRAQLDESSYEGRADAIIRNEGDEAALASQVDQFWQTHIAPRLKK